MQSDPASAVKFQPSAASHLTALLAQFAALKSGWKTSELYVTAAGMVFAAVTAWLGKLPPEWAAVIIALAAAVYQLLRASAKQDHADSSRLALEQLCLHISETSVPAVLVPAQSVPTNETAGTTVKQPATTIPAPGSSAAGFAEPKLLIVLVILGALLITSGVMLLFAGCASGVTNAQKSAVAKQVAADVLKTAVNAGLAYATGNDLAAVQGAASGLYTIAADVQPLTNVAAAQLVTDTAVAFSGSKSAQTSILASQLGTALINAAPQTPADRTAAVVAMGNALFAAIAPAANGAAKAAPAAGN